MYKPVSCGPGNSPDPLTQYTSTAGRDRATQTVISVILGLTAFLSFCVHMSNVSDERN